MTFSSDRCIVKGCAFPAVVEGRCHAHFSDLTAERSLLGSSVPEMVKMAPESRYKERHPNQD